MPEETLDTTNTPEETPTETPKETETPTEVEKDTKPVEEKETPKETETPTEPEKKEAPKEDKKETPKEEEKETPKDDKSDELEKVTKDLEKANQAVEQNKKEITTLKATNKQLEDALEGIVKEQLASFPKDIEKLMPQGSALEKMAWIKQAKEVGITKPKEIGKPIQADKTKEQSTANKKLNPTQRMSNVFSKAFGL